MAAAAVSFRDVEYTQPGAGASTDRVLLHGVCAALEPGSVTALLGRSGSGKTTLLRMVNGLVQPTGGSVQVDGRSAREWPAQALRRRVGYVIQETGLFPHMTVERNAGLALELAGQSAEQRSHRVREVLALAGLDGGFAGRMPWQLSGGQRQRVGLARALAADPAVLLMDEPFGALDPLSRAEMQTTLRDLQARVRKTVLLVTHDLDEALYLADRVLFLDRGQLVADLPAGEVLRSEFPSVRAYVTAVHRASAA